MPTVSFAPSPAAPRFRHPALTVAVAALFFVVVLLLIGARAPVDAQSAPTQVQRAQSASKVADRTQEERAWNELEDRRASLYVGQPGIY